MSQRRLVRGATVMPLDGRRVLRRTDVLMEGGVIAAVGGMESAGAVVSEVRGVLLPALVQAHLHIDETLLDRHFVPDQDPRVYRGWELPAWRRALDAEAVRVQAESAFARALSAGTGAIADVSVGGHRELVVEAARRFGARLVLALDATAGSGRADAFERLVDRAEEELAARDATSHVSVALYAGDAERASRRRLSAAAAVAVERGLPLIVHAGTLPGDDHAVARLARARALSKNLVLCHAGGRAVTGRKNLDRLAEAGVSVVLTPGFDVLSGAPIPPVAELVSRGINVALGSETGATRLDLDPFKEARLLFRLLEGRVDRPASRALEIATRGGARALNRPCGSIEVGHRADLVVVDVPVDAHEDHETIAERILEAAAPDRIRTVWIEGDVVAENGRTTLAFAPPEEVEEGVRARLGFQVERDAKRARSWPRALVAFVERRRRASRGWHVGRLPFEIGDARRE